MLLLAGQAALILILEQRQDEALLGAEVVVQLAQRYSGLIGHLAGRQAAVAIREEPAPRRVKDERASVCCANCGFRQGLTPLHAYGRWSSRRNYVILRMLSVRSPPSVLAKHRADA